MADRPHRNRWLALLARWLRAVADAAENAGRGDARRDKPSANGEAPGNVNSEGAGDAAGDGALPGSPWAASSGPPAHWAALVRNSAPHLLRPGPSTRLPDASRPRQSPDAQRGMSRAQPPTFVEPPPKGPADARSTPLTWPAAAPGAGPHFDSDFPPVLPPAQPAPPRYHEAPPGAAMPMGTWPEIPNAQAPQRGVVYPEADRPSERTGAAASAPLPSDDSAPADPARRLDRLFPEDRPGPTSTSRVSFPSGDATVGEGRTLPPQPANPSAPSAASRALSYQWTDEGAPARPPDPAWPAEDQWRLAPARRQLEHPGPAGGPSHRMRWPEGLPVSAPRADAPDRSDEPADEPADPWPALPEPRPDDRAASVALALRERDHERRLDLEQQGVPWSA